MLEPDEPHFPEQGILWRGWSDETVCDIAERARLVLLFVADPDPFVWPFLREILKAMRANITLRELLHEACIPLFIKADELPRELNAPWRWQQLPYCNLVAQWPDADGDDQPRPRQPPRSRRRNHPNP